MNKFLRSLFIFLLIPVKLLFAQDDLLKELEATKPKDTDYAIQTFKGTRLVNGQTVETKAKGTLEFIFAHRFGAINTGLYEMYGLDHAYVRYGLEYGITDRLGVGIGRNSADKVVDTYLRYKVLGQSSGARNFPFTMTAYGNFSYKASPKDGVSSVDRLAYVGQLLIARKFGPRLSLQVMPTIIHRNAVEQLYENNNQVAVGFGGRIKVSKSVALTSEYYYRVSPNGNTKNYNSIGFGVDIETGGHVFQIILTNTLGLTERAFITETNEKFFDGGIHIGFNVTRTFQLKHK